MGCGCQEKKNRADTNRDIKANTISIDALPQPMREIARKVFKHEHRMRTNT